MKLFDSHTHIHFPLYDADREAVIERAKKAGVKMLCVGTQAASSEAAVELAKKNPGEIWATAGFHPNHLRSPDAPVGAGWYHDKKEQNETEREEFDATRLRKIAENPEVVAIGEFGLDYYRLTDEGKAAQPLGEPRSSNERESQQEAFQIQVDMAKDLQKAMMLHCRPSKGTDDAYIEADRILSTFENLPPRIFHFYVGSLRITKKLVASGAYFTFGGVITFPPKAGKFSGDYDEIIKYIPIDRILLETDAPYVAPAPHRGKRNEPSYIIETAKKLAEIKGVSAEEVATQTTANALKIFGI